MMWDGHDGMGWWMVLGTVWWVLFWGLIIWAFFKVAGGGSASEATGNRPSSPTLK